MQKNQKKFLPKFVKQKQSEVITQLSLSQLNRTIKGTKCNSKRRIFLIIFKMVQPFPKIKKDKNKNKKTLNDKRNEETNK